MSARYAPLPNPHTDPHAIDEMEAAFDDSDDEDDDPPHPLSSRSRNGYHSLPNADPLSSLDREDRHPQPHSTATYNFENTEFDYIRPPPGSPPRPTPHALPNEFGNSNGLVPSFADVPTDVGAARRNWLRRTAVAVLPTHYVQRLGWSSNMGSGSGAMGGPVGGGTGNDGVFANVTAKPSRPRRVQDGDNILLVPEEVQKEVPPTYAQAQADAVPPYWETTIHAPSAANTPGEVIIDALPTGSLFSFLWNMLVSVSFQFVGFLLTYLLHTTHAAKLGSRAGLGITLIQYGFAMRGRDDFSTGGGSGAGDADGDIWAGWKGAAGEPRPTFSTAADAEAYYKNLSLGINATAPAVPTPTVDGSLLAGDATSEWLSFLLMTVGWFILLTSLLGFWRVKRWERGILAAQAESPAQATPEERARSAAIVHSIERMFGLQGLADGSLLRQGLGLTGAAGAELDAEMGAEEEEGVQPNTYILPLDEVDPGRHAQIARAYADEARLHQDLRSAGLL